MSKKFLIIYIIVQIFLLPCISFAKNTDELSRDKFYNFKLIDENTLVLSTEDVEFWDIKNKKLISKIKIKDDLGNRCFFNLIYSNKEYLLIGSYEPKSASPCRYYAVYLIDIKSKKIVKNFPVVAENNYSFINNQVIYKDNDPKITIWDFNSGKVLKDISGVSGYIYKDKIISIGGMYIDITDLKTGKSLKSFKLSNLGFITDFSIKNNYMTICSSDGYITLWNINNGKVLKRLKLNRKESTPISADIWKNNLVVNVDAYQENIQMVDIKTGNIKKTIYQDTRGTSIRIVKDNLIVSWTNSRYVSRDVWIVKVFDLKKNKHLYELELNSDSSLKITENEFIASTKDKKIKTYSIDSGKLLRTIQTNSSNISSFDIQENKMVTYSDGEIAFWDIKKNKQIRKIKVQNDINSNTKELFLNGNNVILSYLKERIQVFDLTTQKYISSFDYSEHVNSFISNEKNLVASVKDGYIYIFDVNDKNKLNKIKVGKNNVSLMSIYEDKIVLFIRDEGIKILDINKKQITHELNLDSNINFNEITNISLYKEKIFFTTYNKTYILNYEENKIIDTFDYVINILKDKIYYLDNDRFIVKNIENNKIINIINIKK